MGATVTTNKAVAGFVTTDGRVFYVLFEETYEKNVYPHDAHWSARAIGTFDQVMLRVFQGAGSCEGGGLQIRGGHTTPEAYIQRWYDAFKEPMPMLDTEITIELGGKSLYAPIPDEKVDAALAALRVIDREDLIVALQGGPIKLQLHRDIDVIVALFGVAGPLSLWTIIRNGPPHGFVDKALVPPARKAAVAPPVVEAFLLDDVNVVVSIGRAPFRNAGWCYSAVGHYCVDVAMPLELHCQGVAKKMIRDFRQKLNSAAKLPGGTRITVTPSKGTHRYYRENATKLAVRLGVVLSDDAVPETYQVTFDQVQDAGEMYLLTSLEQGQVVWSVPVAIDQPAALPSHAVQAQSEQHALF